MKLKIDLETLTNANSFKGCTGSLLKVEFEILLIVQVEF